MSDFSEFISGDIETCDKSSWEELELCALAESFFITLGGIDTASKSETPEALL